MAGPAELGPAALIRDVRLVPVGGFPAPDGLDSLRMRGGRVTQVGPSLTPGPGEEVHDGAGLWAIPGLWDQHVHMVQWGLIVVRLDLTAHPGPTR